MFVDKAIITIKSGNGGNGCTSFKSFKGKPNGGPDGGDGGNGGNVIFKAVPHMNNLVNFKYMQHYRAEAGLHGTSNFCFGKRGKDCIIGVPPGTVIRDKETGNIVADMFYIGDEVLVLTGGRGGKGNAKFATATRKTPFFSQLGEKGLETKVVLELKTIADAGFCGFPNVGKSTLLSVLTNAQPKIANYHFTTLSPNLGAMNCYDQNFILADIPGLIEGASEGAGLGHDFLRHIERTRIIVHVVDVGGEEGRDPYDDYLKIRKELADFSEELAKRPEIIVANKVDCDFSGENLKKFKEKIGDKKVIALSALSRQNTDELKKEIFEHLKDLEEIKPLEYEAHEYSRGDGDEFHIEREDDGAYVVFGPYIDNLARNVVVDNIQSMAYLQRSLKLSGVISELRKKGAKDGDHVRILDIEFDFVD